MPKSKQRKGHKKKVQNYLNQKKAAENKARKILMEQYQKMEEERMAKMNTQKAGEDVENADIDVDLDIDDMGIDNLETDDVVMVANIETTETTNETSEPIYQLVLPPNGKVGDTIDLVVNVNNEKIDGSKIENIKLSNKRIIVSDDNNKLDLVKPGICKITTSINGYKLISEIEVIEE